MAKKRSSPRQRADGGRRITLDDIAEACGVSRMTVSYALRGHRQFVSESNIERIRQVAQRMGYDPAVAHAARSLRYQNQSTNVASYVAAVFFPVQLLEMHYYAVLFQGIQQAFLENRFGVLSCSVKRDGPALADQLPQIFRRGDVDGAIIMPSVGYDARLVEALRGTPGFVDRPMVSLLEPMPECDNILADDQAVGYLAASHLLRLGHRNLLWFRNPEVTNHSVEQRHLGHKRAFDELGLNMTEHLHIEPWIWEDPRGVEAAIRDILDRLPGITGILAPNDGTGIPLARALRRLGYRIPEQISIIGADDCEAMLGPEDRNIWTTVRVPLLELGRAAASRLIDRINAPQQTPETIEKPVELIERGTTAPPCQG